MSLLNKFSDFKYKLPDYKPDQDVWMKIEKQLNFEEYLSEQMTKLPDYQPQINAWDRISSNLPKRKIISFRIPYFSVAASIVAVVAFVSLIFQVFTKDIPVVSEVNNHSLTENTMEETAINEIRSYCSVQMPVCEQGNFKELMQLYDELDAEEIELKKAMQHLGDSPEMIQAMIKIENMKSKTIQDLILIIQS